MSTGEWTLKKRRNAKKKLSYLSFRCPVFSSVYGFQSVWYNFWICLAALKLSSSSWDSKGTRHYSGRLHSPSQGQRSSWSEFRGFREVGSWAFRTYESEWMLWLQTRSSLVRALQRAGDGLLFLTQSRDGVVIFVLIWNVVGPAPRRSGLPNRKRNTALDILCLGKTARRKKIQKMTPTRGKGYRGKPWYFESVSTLQYFPLLRYWD